MPSALLKPVTRQLIRPVASMSESWSAYRGLSLKSGSQLSSTKMRVGPSRSGLATSRVGTQATASANVVRQQNARQEQGRESVFIVTILIPKRGEHGMTILPAR